MTIRERFAEKIKHAVDHQNPRALGRLQDALRFKYGQNYDQFMEIAKEGGADPADVEDLLIELEDIESGE